MEKLDPLVSVVLPTFNRASVILPSIKSVLGQTYSNIELIIVDDCSNDDTENVIKSINDDRIRYIKNEENKGANYSRNRGITLAKGEYVAFEDSDDIWHKEKLERQIKVLQETDADLVYSYYNYFRDGVEKIYPINKDRYSTEQKNENILDVLLKENIIITATILVKKDSLMSVGLFDETMPRMQEWELCIRLAQKYKFTCLEMPLTDVYFTKDSITNKPELLVEAESKMVKKHCQIMHEYSYLSEFVYNLLSEIVKYSDDDEQLEQFFTIFDRTIDREMLKKLGLRMEDLYDRAYAMFREKVYADISMKWIIHCSNGRQIDDVMKANQWNEIAIYGYGQLGESLYKFIKLFSDVNVVAILDKNISNVDNNDIPVVGLDNIEKYQEKIDCIIVTPMFAFSAIKKDLMKKVNKPIIPLNDLFGT